MESHQRCFLTYIDKCNPSIPEFKKLSYLKIVDKLLRQTGAQSRYWRDLRDDVKSAFKAYIDAQKFYKKNLS